MSFLVHDMVGWAPSIESILVSARSMNSAGHFEGTSANQGVAGAGPTTIGEEQLIALSQRGGSEGTSVMLFYGGLGIILSYYHILSLTINYDFYYHYYLFIY
jgi:hypothetical protein